MKPVGPTFHRSFPLQRAVLSQYVQAVQDLGGSASAAQIRDSTGLGTMKIPSAQGYGKATGLLDKDGALSSLGREVLKHDPHLLSPTTLWILHLMLIGASEQAPQFWRQLWSAINIGTPLSREAVVDVIEDSYGKELINRESARVTGTAFISSYANSDGLQELGLVRKTKDGLIGSLASASVPAGPVALFLLSMWEQKFPDQVTVSLDKFLSSTRFANAFHASSSDVDQLLESVNSMGVVELYRTAPPYQIAKLHSLSDVLERVYDGN